MPVDAITLAALADEWRTLLANARVDTIIQPSEYALALQCYTPATPSEGGRNRWLYLSAHPQMARTHITALKPPKIASEPPPFVMLLRKYLEGTHIAEIRQLRWERVLEIISGHRLPDDQGYVQYHLLIEIMGRLSNIILCDAHGLILGSLKRVGADVNRYRTIAANVAYVPPPPQQRTYLGQQVPRLEPTTVTAATLAACVADEIDLAATAASAASANSVAKPARPGKKPAREATLWQVLTRHLLGFSPLLAREAVYRACGHAEAPLEAVEAVEAVEARYVALADSVHALAALYDSHAWQPTLVERAAADPTAAATPVAFAPYFLEQYAAMPDMRLRQSPSINVLIDDYHARAEWHDAMEGVHAPLRKLLHSQLERCQRKAELLRQELAHTQEAPRYRLHAELLLASQHEVQQGPSSVTLPNIFLADEQESSQSTVTIALDPRFDAVGNANRLFHKYHKLRRATAAVAEQLQQNVTEMAILEQFLVDLALAETPAEVALVKAEVQTAGYVRGAPAKSEKKAQKGKGGKHGKGKPVLPGGGVPISVRSREGFTVLVGKNSRQNEEVTFRQAGANDLWLHARGVPGSHVIIKAAGRDIPPTTLEQAARLAAYYSQARANTTVPVDYTLQRYVRHMKGAGPGMVVYERERTLNVPPLPLA